mmetsp:Transcript_35315/g.34331  ORF Transcript_35315/g.34331 Transcript_35315/m.34331 type:complete len:82 (-) Transcript_35315:1094-1339(-)
MPNYASLVSQGGNNRLNLFSGTDFINVATMKEKYKEPANFNTIDSNEQRYFNQSALHNLYTNQTPADYSNFNSTTRNDHNF